jgi:hypothetical protein
LPTELVDRQRDATATVLMPHDDTPERRGVPLLLKLVMVVGLAVGAVWAWFNLAPLPDEAVAPPPAATPTPPTDPPPDAPQAPPDADPTGAGVPAPAPDATEPDATEPDATEPDATEPDATEPDEGSSGQATSVTPRSSSRKSQRERSALKRAANAIEQGHAEMKKKGYASSSAWPANVRRSLERAEKASGTNLKEKRARTFRADARKAPRAESTTARKDPPKAKPTPNGFIWLTKQLKKLSVGCDQKAPECNKVTLVTSHKSAKTDAARIQVEKRAQRCLAKCK